MLSLLLLKRRGRVEAQPVGKRLIGFSMIDRGSVTSPTNGRMASQILIQMQVWCLGISARKSATTSSREGRREVNMIRILTVSVGVCVFGFFAEVTLVGCLIF